jgi:hypothetical protein
MVILVRNMTLLSIMTSSQLVSGKEVVTFELLYATMKQGKINYIYIKDSNCNLSHFDMLSSQIYMNMGSPASAQPGPTTYLGLTGQVWATILGPTVGPSLPV